MICANLKVSPLEIEWQFKDGTHNGITFLLGE